MIVSTCYQKISSNQFHHIAIILLIINPDWEVYGGLNAKNMISVQRGKSHFIYKAILSNWNTDFKARWGNTLFIVNYFS